MTLRQVTLRHVLKYSILAIGITLFIGYVVFQARFLIIGPYVILDDIATIQTNRVVELSGLATNIIGITLNGRPIYTDKNGYFKETVILENGYTVVTVVGTDRYGRTTVVEQPFWYERASSTATSTSAASSLLTI